MAKKTVGYTELEWTCKRCNTINKGLQKTCSNCGSPMSEEDKFELPDQQVLITDKEEVVAADKGADVHCPFCGARNASNSKNCNQCGGDLTSASQREAGEVIGAFQNAPAPDIDCPFCNAKVKAGSARCPNCGGDLTSKPDSTSVSDTQGKKRFPLWLIGLIFLVVLCLGGIIGYAILSSRTTDVQGIVQEVSWKRVIAIEEFRDTQRGAWKEDLPDDAANVSCNDRQREISDEQVAKSTEVCGTPYTIDQGSGLGEVVQDCKYLVYDSYCEFTEKQWQIVDHRIAEGSGTQPTWPTFQLAEGQREGQRQETYIIAFLAAGKLIEYRLADQEEYERFKLGSDWNLKINSFGSILDVVP
jgi:hypothetical protein